MASETLIMRSTNKYVPPALPRIYQYFYLTFVFLRRKRKCPKVQSLESANFRRIFPLCLVCIENICRGIICIFVSLICVAPPLTWTLTVTLFFFFFSNIFLYMKKHHACRTLTLALFYVTCVLGAWLVAPVINRLLPF